MEFEGTFKTKLNFYDEFKQRVPFMFMFKFIKYLIFFEVSKIAMTIFNQININYFTSSM